MRLNRFSGLAVARLALVTLFTGLAGCGNPWTGEEKTNLGVRGPRGGFTGPGVASLVPLLGDYTNYGVRTPEDRTDIDRLLVVLEELGAQDYMHLVWQEERFPSGWQDFQILAPRFQEAKIGLWLYLTPPSEGVPDPFGADYVRWATECAKIAARYPVVEGICIDDFNGNVRKFTPSYCREMMDEAHTIAPHLSLLVVCYFGYQETMVQHVREGAIDGVIFPYFYPHRNLSGTTKLLPQIRSYRSWLDEQTDKGGLTGKMPLVVMIYAKKHSQSIDEPTPEYVKKCLEIGLGTARDGLTDGVVTFCLPKANPAFVDSVASVYEAWAAEKR